MCCVGTYRKRKENAGAAWEPMENAKKTQVLRWNRWKTQGKHRCCVGTNGKHMENVCFALDPMENTTKTRGLLGNL